MKYLILSCALALLLCAGAYAEDSTTVVTIVDAMLGEITSFTASGAMAGSPVNLRLVYANRGNVDQFINVSCRIEKDGSTVFSTTLLTNHNLSTLGEADLPFSWTYTQAGAYVATAVVDAYSPALNQTNQSSAATSFIISSPDISTSGGWGGPSTSFIEEAPAEAPQEGAPPLPAEAPKEAPQPAEPPETECTEDWYCTSWSGCADGSQTRTCTDLGGCGTENSKPQEAQACIPPPVVPLGMAAIVIGILALVAIAIIFVRLIS
ncbi:MAG: hypothetical protein ACE5FW_03255 [Candidatus Aenigmatarchaeota archaeon]